MKPRTRVVFGMSVFFVLLFAIACAKPANDNQVVSDIQSRLSADSGLQGKQLTVQSEKGTVTLSGTVDNQAQRDAAAKYAASEPGVKTVVNNLQVGASQSPVETSAAPAPEPTPAPSAPKSKPSPSNKSSKKAHHAAESNNQMAQSSPPPAQNASAPPSQDPASQPAQQAAAAPPPPPEVKKVTDRKSVV